MAYKRGSGTPALVGGTLLDVVEGFDGFDGSAKTSSGQVEYQSYNGAGWGLHVSILPNINGVINVVNNAATGRVLLEFPSAAARVTRVGGATSFSMPAAQRFQDAVSIPEAMLRPFRRYTFTVPVRVTVDGAAAVEIGLASSNGGLTFLGLDPAFVWSATGAGSAWLPRSRRVTGGGITDGPSSGVLRTGWHLLGIRYTEGLTPRIEFLLDGATRHTISGDANMPVYASTTVFLYPFIGVNAPAGTTLQQSMARFTVEEV
jgi:hypothetical protein